VGALIRHGALAWPRLRWVEALWPGRHDLIAIDGKTARRTHDQRKGLKAQGNRVKRFVTNG